MAEIGVVIICPPKLGPAHDPVRTYAVSSSLKPDRVDLYAWSSAAKRPCGDHNSDPFGEVHPRWRQSPFGPSRSQFLLLPRSAESRITRRLRALNVSAEVMGMTRTSAPGPSAGMMTSGRVGVRPQAKTPQHARRMRTRELRRSASFLLLQLLRFAFDSAPRAPENGATSLGTPTSHIHSQECRAHEHGH